MYVVIVCTKCRKHAQIIQLGISKYTKCQRCEKRLEVSKLQFFAKSENYDEIVAARTTIQAQLSDQSFSRHKQPFDIETDEIKKGNKQHKVIKDPAIAILNYLSIEKEIELVNLVDYCKTLDIRKEQVQETINKLENAGIIYYPKVGQIKKI